MEQKRTVLVVGDSRSGKTEFIRGCEKMCSIVFSNDTVLRVKYVECRTKEEVNSIYKYRPPPDGVVIMFNWKNDTHYSTSYSSESSYIGGWVDCMRKRFGVKIPMVVCGSHSTQASTLNLLKSVMCSLILHRTKRDIEAVKAEVVNAIGQKNAFPHEVSYFSIDSPHHTIVTRVIHELLFS